MLPQSTFTDDASTDSEALKKRIETGRDVAILAIRAVADVLGEGLKAVGKTFDEAFTQFKRAALTVCLTAITVIGLWGYYKWKTHECPHAPASVHQRGLPEFNAPVPYYQPLSRTTVEPLIRQL